MRRFFYLTVIITLLCISQTTAQNQLELRFGNGLLFETSSISNAVVQSSYVDYGYTECAILGLNSQIKGFFWLKNEVAIRASTATIKYQLSGQSTSFPWSLNHRVNEVTYTLLPEFRYEFVGPANFKAALFINAGPSLIMELSNSHHPHFPSNGSKIGILVNGGITAKFNRIGATFQISYFRHKPGMFTEPLIPQHVWHTLLTSQGLVYLF